jgi:hypothetical protein
VFTPETEANTKDNGNGSQYWAMYTPFSGANISTHCDLPQYGTKVNCRATTLELRAPRWRLLPDSKQRNPSLPSLPMASRRGAALCPLRPAKREELGGLK